MHESQRKRNQRMPIVQLIAASLAASALVTARALPCCSAGCASRRQPTPLATSWAVAAHEAWWPRWRRRSPPHQPPPHPPPLASLPVRCRAGPVRHPVRLRVGAARRRPRHQLGRSPRPPLRGALPR
eukprot:1178117-Prymnesium_polylepis.2